MGTRTLKAIQNTYAMPFVVVFLGLQATLAFATPLEQERFFDLDQERFFDLCEKITAITKETSTLPPECITEQFTTTSTTEEVTTTTSTLPSTTTTEEVTTEKVTLAPPTGGRC